MDFLHLLLLPTNTVEGNGWKIFPKMHAEFFRLYSLIFSDALKDPERYKDDKGPLSSHMDLKTQKEFEKKFEQYRTKTSAFTFQNILWLLGAIAVFHFTDFVLVLRYDPRVNR